MSSSVTKIQTVILLILGAALSLQPALAQSNPSAEARLRSEVVTEQDGKFTIDRFSICQLHRPAELGGGASEPFQVKSHMEASVDGFISRDNFVTFSTEIGFQSRPVASAGSCPVQPVCRGQAVHYRPIQVSFAADFIQGLTAIEAIGALQCKLLEAPIGKVDLELDVYMTPDGVQVGMLETGSGERDTQTRTWNQMLGQ